MGRLIVLLVLLATLIAVVMFVVSALREATKAGRTALGVEEGALMGPSGMRKISFVVLIALMAGLASGLIGGI